MEHPFAACSNSSIAVLLLERRQFSGRVMCSEVQQQACTPLYYEVELLRCQITAVGLACCRESHILAWMTPP
jgi:hypothetical protein